MTTTDTPAQTRFHAACGRVVRGWSGLEQAFVAYLRIFLDSDEHRARIVWRTLPTTAARHGLLRALASAYLDEQRQRQLADLLERAEAQCIRRDLIVEGAGGLDLRSGRVVFAGGHLPPGNETAASGQPPAPGHSATSHLIPGHIELTIEEIEGWAMDIAVVETAAMKWLRTLSTTLRGSPRHRN